MASGQEIFLNVLGKGFKVNAFVDVEMNDERALAHLFWSLASINGQLNSNTGGSSKEFFKT